MAKFRRISNFFSLSVLAFLFSLCLPTQAAPIRISLDHEPILSASPYEDIIIRATPSDGSQVKQLILFYRGTGKKLYESTYMSRGSTGTYTGVIPSSIITPRGIVYFIAARDVSDGEIMLFGSPDRPHAVSTRSVVVLKSSNLSLYEDVLLGLKRESGIEFKEFNLSMSPDAGKRIIARLEKQPPEVVVTLGLKAALRIRQSSLSKKVPIVYSMIADPESSALRVDQSTGVSFDISVKTHLRTFKKMIPNLRRVGIIYNPDRTASMIEEAKALAPSMGFEILATRIEESGEVAPTLRAFEKGIDALWVIPDSTVVKTENFNALASFSRKHRIPLFVFSQNLVKQGALVALSPDYLAIGNQTGHLVQRILEGTNAAKLPATSPQKLRVSLNMRTAEELQLEGIAKRVVEYAADNDFDLKVYK